MEIRKSLTGDMCSRNLAELELCFPYPADCARAGYSPVSDRRVGTRAERVAQILRSAPADCGALPGVGYAEPRGTRPGHRMRPVFRGARATGKLVCEVDCARQIIPGETFCPCTLTTTPIAVLCERASLKLFSAAR